MDNDSNKQLLHETTEIGGVVRQYYNKYQQARARKEQIWGECWAVYNGTPEALKYTAQLAKKTVGNVETEWRHRINPGKAYEVVETVNAYLQSAFFPNRDWFDLTPTQPGDGVELAPAIRKFMKESMHNAGFRSAMDMFTRQACITGFSVMAMPWRREAIPYNRNVNVEIPVLDEMGEPSGSKVKTRVQQQTKIVYDAPQFEVLSSFDCFLDPDNRDLSRSNFIRRVTLSKAALWRLVENGTYSGLTAKDISGLKQDGFRQEVKDQSATRKQTVVGFQGIDETIGSETTTLIEFWGDVTCSDCVHRDVVVTMVGDVVVKFEQNPFWCGRPFVIATYTPNNHSVYGMGVLEPNLSMLHQLGIITNQRLDNLELAVDCMWTYVPDGTVDERDLFTAPGKVIAVADHNSIKPLQHNQQFSITYTESQLLETQIDKSAGTGAFISTGQGRSGERVTAQEVQAVRDAGGNRLGRVHAHLEQTALEQMLLKTYRQMQQFVLVDKTIRIPGFNGGEFIYVNIGVDELQHDFDIRAVGAGHIADKEFELQKHLNFVQTVQNNPEMSQLINWEQTTKLLANKFGIDDVEKYMKSTQAPAPEAPSAPTIVPTPGVPQPVQPSPQEIEELNQRLEAQGGKPMLDYARSQVAVDGGSGMIEQMTPALGSGLS
jgi:hypothetical protein